MSSVSVSFLNNCMVKDLLSKYKMLTASCRLPCTITVMFIIVQLYRFKLILNSRLRTLALTATSDLNYTFTLFVRILLLSAPFLR